MINFSSFRTHAMFSKRLDNFLLFPGFIYKYHPNFKALRDMKSFVCDWIIKKTESNTSQSEELTENVFINRFMKIKDNLDPQSISDQLSTFFGAGIETLSTASANCMLLLAMHPEIQQKVYDEITQVFPDADNSTITPEKLNELKYFEQVMNETMRLLPVLPLIARETLEEFALNPKVTLAPQTIIVINLFTLFRRKDVWGEDAEQFVPERFAPENVKQNQLFIPFSMGKRNCIGYRYAYAQFKIIIMKMIRNFIVTTDLKFDKIEFDGKITLKIVGDHTVSIKKRLIN